MARRSKNKRRTKPSVPSKSRGRKIGARLGYGQTNKNINTLRKLRKVQAEEDASLSSEALDEKYQHHESMDQEGGEENYGSSENH
jgi:hypothetical protein